jgi:hypothetical protein|mmetsp:Transcript_10570/g.28117  ORF Transcript_10570/g.28117 Transcript_10570/m.28117 type:complete len:115 (+) Transcript_10570:907-1251(+)
MVYICEAHASDVWPLAFSYERVCPTNDAERAQYARDCARDLGFARAGFRLLCDTMDDTFNAALGAWPTSYYVLDRHAELVFVGQGADGEYGYDARGLVRFTHRLGVRRTSGRLV